MHERDVNTDFLLIVLKKLIDEGANIKVVLMSATMNAEKFRYSVYLLYWYQSTNADALTLRAASRHSTASVYLLYWY